MNMHVSQTQKQLHNVGLYHFYSVKMSQKQELDNYIAFIGPEINIRRLGAQRRESITFDYNASSVEATANILHDFITDAILWQEFHFCAILNTCKNTNNQEMHKSHGLFDMAVWAIQYLGETKIYHISHMKCFMTFTLLYHITMHMNILFYYPFYTSHKILLVLVIA